MILVFMDVSGVKIVRFFIVFGYLDYLGQLNIKYYKFVYNYNNCIKYVCMGLDEVMGVRFFRNIQIYLINLYYKIFDNRICIFIL